MARTIKQTTALLPAARRFEFWQDAILPNTQISLRTSREDFSCARIVTAGARSTVIDTRSMPFGVERHRRQIAQDGFDTVALCTLLSGVGTHSQAGRKIDMRPGDLFVSDQARPYEVETYEPYREARIYINRSLLESRVGRVGNLAGLLLAADTPLVQLFTGYLAGYIEAVPDMTPAELDAGLESLLHLLATLIGQIRPVRVAEGESLTPAEVRDVADAFIARHLANPALDVETIVQGLGISRTRLYNAFTERGGVRAAIRDTRLDEVHARITSSDATIEVLARAAGFIDYPSFYRAFRRRYGASPREIRGGDIAAANRAGKTGAA